MTIDQFRIQVPDDVLADLRDRLTRTRYLSAPSRPGWEGGLGGDRLRALVEGWLAFDWRAEEARLNTVEQGVAVVGGSRVHFARVRGRGDGPHTPLLLLHGWPSAFVEYLPLAELLSDTFEVIIPSLPGFVFSELPEPPLTRRRIAEALHGLMTELGFERYATFGGDIGGGASTWLGADHPDTLRAQYMVATDEVYLAQDAAAFDRAGADLQQVIDGRRRVLGPDHPDTIAAMTVQVRLLAKRGNASDDAAVRHRYLAQAIALERQILASHQQRLGEDHPNTLMAHGSLADLLSYDGQYAEAVREAKLTLAGQRRVLGPQHPVVFATYGLLGDIEVDAGHWAAARAPYEQALAGRDKLLGPGDAHTVETASRLYEVLQHVRDPGAAQALRKRYLDPIVARDPATLNASLKDVRRSALEALAQVPPR